MIENIQQIYSLAPSLTAAFIWGLCSALVHGVRHLAAISSVVGIIGGIDHERVAVRPAFIFGAGVLVTGFMSGGLIVLASFIPYARTVYGAFAAGMLCIIIGFIAARFIERRGLISAKRTGTLATFLLGFFYWLTFGRFTFLFLAPAVAIAMRMSRASIIGAFLIVFMHAAGYAAAVFTAGAYPRVIRGTSTMTTFARTAIYATVAALFGLYLVVGIFLL
ncbi:MAG: hypothetical protein AABZ39_20660 [Spirochaetota bacterium]